MSSSQRHSVIDDTGVRLTGGLQTDDSEPTLQHLTGVSAVFTTFAIVIIPVRISPLFLTGRILSLLPKNLEGKNISP